MSDVLSENKIENKLTLAIAPQNAEHQNNLLERLIDAVIDAVEAGRQIVMDSGQPVGAAFGNYDTAAGHAVAYTNRWGR